MCFLLTDDRLLKMLKRNVPQIAVMNPVDSDYTKYHQRLAREMTPERFTRIIEESERINPYSGSAKII